MQCRTPALVVICAIPMLCVAQERPADKGGPSYAIDRPLLEAKLPIHVKDFAEFVSFGTAINHAESLRDVWEAWRLRKEGEYTGAPNAWIEINARGTVAVHARWTVSQDVEAAGGRVGEDSIVASDELSMFSALQSFAIKATGYRSVVAGEVKFTRWHSLRGRIPDITHQRLAMKWTIHLRKGEKKATRSLLVFPAKAAEDALAIGKGGLRLLYVYEDGADDRARIIRDNGGTSEGE